MKARSEVHGAVSIVNAIASGKGSALGISLKVIAEVEMKKGIETKIISQNTNDYSLVVSIINEIINRYSLPFSGAEITIHSEIPVGKGLKSSSAVGCAVALAACDSCGIEINDQAILDIVVQSSLDSGVSITGALDDSAACYFGGVVLTDNLSRKIIKHVEFNEDLNVVLYVPDNESLTKNVDANSLKLYSNIVNHVFNMAINGSFLDAITLNGLIYSTALNYSFEPVRLAISHGALAAGLSGTGPSVAILCNDDSLDSIVSSIEKLEGSVIKTKVNNEKAKVTVSQ